MAKLPKISDRFSGAYQATEQAERITELQAEVEKLRVSQSPELEQQIATLRSQLLAQSGEQEIAVEQIDPNPYQPRQTITPESIQTLAHSMEKDGQIAPVIVIAQGERYLLWDGQRRFEAAKILGWKTLRAVSAPMPPDLHRKALLTFIHHEDLNSLDKAEAIVKEIAANTGIEAVEIPTVLSTVLRRLERSGLVNQLTALVTAVTEEQHQGVKHLGVSETEEKLLLALLDLALNPASVKANLMPMLSMPKDLKAAIRSGLKGAHALALMVLSAKTLKISERQATKVRIEATNQVIEQDLSVAKTRELIGQIKAKYLKSGESKESKASKQVTAVVRGIEKLSPTVMASANPEQLVQLRQSLQQKLSLIDDILT
ncbi:chromosome partitioning protein ParB [Oscillatoriales cyanobacterium USR001]|nr:chromosome partitioning protein ParB [Oscillatoriales cyanobacterium USR001]